MKSFIFLFAFLSLVFARSNLIKSNDETHGCLIPESKDECCWVNNNGCCQPRTKGQICTMAITTCCKKKVYDKSTGKTTYVYSHGKASS